MAQGELRLLKRAPASIEVGDLLLISNDARAEKKIRRALHGILGLEVARGPRAARAALDSRRWIGCIVDFDHGGSNTLHALATSRSGRALALFDTVDARTRKYLDGRSLLTKYKNWAYLVATWTEEAVCGARDRQWIDVERAVALVEKVRGLRQRRNERGMARKLGIEPSELTWIDRLRASDWRGVPIALQAEILAHGDAALPALLSMLEEEGSPRLWPAELALIIGGRRVIGPLVRIALETKRGLPLPALEQMCELGPIVAKPLFASLPKATPLGRWFAARMLVGLGVRDERIFRLLREEFENPERWTQITNEIGRYGDERFVPILLARIETFDWRRDTPNRGQTCPLDDLLWALHDCGGRLPKRLRARVLDQFIDDHVGGALSRASDESQRWEREIDRVDNEEEARGAFARRFTWWAQPILSQIHDPRAYSGKVWELGCIWARAFTSREDATARDDASDLLRSHRRLFGDYHAMRTKRVRAAKSGWNGG